MTHIKKLSPDTGSKRTAFPIYERKECKSLSFPRLSGKVSAKLTKGASVSRHKKVVFTERHYIFARHSRTE